MNIGTKIYAYKFPFIYEGEITKIEKEKDNVIVWMQGYSFPIELCSESYNDAWEKAKHDIETKYTMEITEAKSKYESRIKSLEEMKKENLYF